MAATTTTAPATALNIPDIDAALKSITQILFNKDNVNDVDWGSQNTNDVVNLQLKKAWINWILGDVDSIVAKLNMGDEIPDGDVSLNAKMILTNESSRDLSYQLAYEIEPKLRMIKDVERSIEKLNYLVQNKNDPDYKRCAYNLDTTLQYLMADVQPQLEQFLHATEINNSLHNIEGQLVPRSPFSMFGGGRGRRRGGRRSAKTSRTRRTRRSVGASRSRSSSRTRGASRSRSRSSSSSGRQRGGSKSKRRSTSGSTKKRTRKNKKHNVKHTLVGDFTSQVKHHGRSRSASPFVRRLSAKPLSNWSW